MGQTVECVVVYAEFLHSGYTQFLKMIFLTTNYLKQMNGKPVASRNNVSFFVYMILLTGGNDAVKRQILTQREQRMIVSQLI